VSKRAAAASAALEKRAKSASKVASDFSAGADGEEALAESLAPLTAKGWLPLSDRQLPGGGNVDQLMIGPAGVAVVDAKNWSYAVTVRNGTIYTGKFSRTKALDSLTRQVELVRAALTHLEFVVPMRGFLALVGDQDKDRIEERVRDIRLLGLERLCSTLQRAPVRLDGAQIEQLFRVMSEAFPPAATTPTLNASVEPKVVLTESPIKIRKIFDVSTRFFYLRTWRRSGHVRLYIKSHEGNDLGWKDVNSGQLTLSCSGPEAKVVQAVLNNASLVGVTLATDDLPQVGFKVPGGKLLAWMKLFSSNVLVGQEWSKRGTRRLYGTLISPGYGTFQLGFVDLKNGQIQASVNGKVAKDFDTAERYLQVLYERMPTTSSQGNSSTTRRR
jgi:hypothetical protein